MRDWEYIEDQLRRIGFVEARPIRELKHYRLVEATDPDGRRWRSRIGWYPLTAKWFLPYEDGRWPVEVCLPGETREHIKEWVVAWKVTHGRWPRPADAARELNVDLITARSWMREMRRFGIFPTQANLVRALVTDGLIAKELWRKEGRCVFCGKAEHTEQCPVRQWNERPGHNSH